jgi:phosphoribosyl 1,2-cyclic phosphate phosphodiesterase
MIVTFLGTGTSHGVPMIGCSCPTCLSADPHDKRTNASLLITCRGRNILLDCGRDFRQQALRERLTRVDYVLLTHTHFDHVAGIDDLRVFNRTRGEAIPLFGRKEHLDYLRTYIYHYLFDDNVQKGGGVTELDLVALDGRFLLEGMVVEPLPVFHGSLPILGFRIGALAYLTDVSAIPQSTLQRLYGLDLLVLGALRQTTHPTHFCVEQALEVARQVRPRRTLLTHIAHDLKHADWEARLGEPGGPGGAGTPETHLAYDGLTLEI